MELQTGNSSSFLIVFLIQKKKKTLKNFEIIYNFIQQTFIILLIAEVDFCGTESSFKS